MQNKKINSWTDLQVLLLYPLKALYSKRFYFDVLFRMSGLGFIYLLFISMLIAVPSTKKIMVTLSFFDNLELPVLVGQLPPGHINANGVLVADDGTNDYKLLRNSKGQPALLFNPADKKLEGDAVNAPVELTSSSFKVTVNKSVNIIPYSSLFDPGTRFNPYEMAMGFDLVFSSSFFTVWGLLTVWFYSTMIINALIAGAFSRFFLMYMSGIKVSYVSSVRLCSFANTLVALILLGQFFIAIPVGYSVMLFIPVIYVILFGREFRRELSTLGIDKFRGKYGFQAQSQSHPQDYPERDPSRQADIDALTGRNSPVHDDNRNDVTDCESDKEDNTLKDEGNADSSANQSNDQNKENRSGPGSFAP